MTKVKITMGNRTYEVSQETYLRMQSSLKQSDRRDVARQLKNNGMTYQEVGDTMGVSRQRACQLVMPTKSERAKLFPEVAECYICKKKTKKLEAHHEEYTNAPSHLLCHTCHKWLHRKTRNGKPPKSFIK